jgi:hypothetical protein
MMERTGKEIVSGETTVGETIDPVENSQPQRDKALETAASGQTGTDTARDVAVFQTEKEPKNVNNSDKNLSFAIKATQASKKDEHLVSREPVAGFKNVVQREASSYAQVTEEEKKSVFAEVRCHSTKDLPFRAFIYRPGANLPETVWRDLEPGQSRTVDVILPLEFYTVFNPAFPRRQLWGRGPYTADSDLVAALVHQGYMAPFLHYIVPPGAFPYTERVLFGRAHEHDSEQLMPSMNMAEGLGISSWNDNDIRAASPTDRQSCAQGFSSIEPNSSELKSDVREILARIRVRRLGQEKTVIYPSVYQNEVHSRRWVHWNQGRPEPFYEIEIQCVQLLYASAKKFQGLQHPMEFIGNHLQSTKRKELTRQSSGEGKTYGYLKHFCDALSLSSPIMQAATASAFINPNSGASSFMRSTPMGGMDVAKRRKIAFLHEHRFRFNLSMDPCLTYGLHLVADRGARREWRLSARLASEAIYFENSEGRRFELSQFTMDSAGHDLYRFAEILAPRKLDRKQMISAGIPLPSGFTKVPRELCSLSEESITLTWSDISFGADYLSIKGFVIPRISSIFFIPCSGKSQSESSGAQADDSTNAAEIDEELPLYNESENEQNSEDEDDPSMTHSEETSNVSLARRRGEGANGDKIGSSLGRNLISRAPKP